MSDNITHQFVRRLIGFVVCCDRVNQQKHRRHGQQGHDRDFMRNSHFFVLRDLLRDLATEKRLQRPDQYTFQWGCVTAKILMLLLNQKLNNYRGSDVRGDRQFELSLQND